VLLICKARKDRTCSQSILECVETKERKRQYNLDRYYADPEKFKDYQADYYKEHAEEIKARMRRYRKMLAARNRKIASLVLDSLAKDRSTKVQAHTPI
jgi:hypothetical protein